MQPFDKLLIPRSMELGVYPDGLSSYLSLFEKQRQQLPSIEKSEACSNKSRKLVSAPKQRNNCQPLDRCSCCPGQLSS